MEGGWRTPGKRKSEGWAGRCQPEYASRRDRLKKHTLFYSGIPFQKKKEGGGTEVARRKEPIELKSGRKKN